MHIGCFHCVSINCGSNESGLQDGVQTLKHVGKHIVQYFSILFVYIIFGIVVYHVVEDCYFETSSRPRPGEVIAAKAICKALSQKNLLNVSSDDIKQDLDGSLRTNLIIDLCVHQILGSRVGYDIESRLSSKAMCNVDRVSVSKWLEFVLSTIFTIGKFHAYISI